MLEISQNIKDITTFQILLKQDRNKIKKSLWSHSRAKRPVLIIPLLASEYMEPDNLPVFKNILSHISQASGGKGCHGNMIFLICRGGQAVNRGDEATDDLFADKVGIEGIGARHAFHGFDHLRVDFTEVGQRFGNQLGLIRQARRRAGLDFGNRV